MDSALWFGGDSTTGTFRYTIAECFYHTESLATDLFLDNNNLYVSLLSSLSFHVLKQAMNKKD
jgi:hypothetical protein